LGRGTFVHDSATTTSETAGTNRAECHADGDGRYAKLECFSGSRLLPGAGIDEIELSTRTDGSGCDDDGDDAGDQRVKQSDALPLAGKCNECGRDEWMVDGRVYDVSWATLTGTGGAGRVERHADGDGRYAKLECFSGSQLLPGGGIDRNELPDRTDRSPCDDRNDAGDQRVKQSDDLPLAGKCNECGRDEWMELVLLYYYYAVDEAVSSDESECVEFHLHVCHA
jgi:hypothetical protein